MTSEWNRRAAEGLIRIDDPAEVDAETIWWNKAAPSMTNRGTSG